MVGISVYAPVAIPAGSLCIATWQEVTLPNGETSRGWTIASVSEASEAFVFAGLSSGDVVAVSGLRNAAAAKGVVLHRNDCVIPP